jgi:iron complex outermembrane receptor protein
MKKTILLLGISYLSVGLAAETPKKKVEQAEEVQQLDEVTVSSQNNPKNPKKLFPVTDKATPNHTVTAAEVEKITNTNSAEDVVRKMPSVNIRKRYIGDTNSPLGMRDSNAYQTAHTMVYGDGIPLHNPLRTSFSGAPRWHLVSPSEIDSAQVLYGPFSAEYSGNAMGGVVKLNTRMPDKFEMDAETMGIFQPMNRAGRKETLMGYKTFISAGNRWDKFSAYASYNRLENEGQPMIPNTIGVTPGTTGTKATGGTFQPLPNGAAGILYGDDGIQQSTSDLFKFKLGYDFTPDLQGRFTLAYEDRQVTTNDAQSQLRDAKGNIIWGGATNVAGQRFTVPNSAFGSSVFERKTLNYGVSLKGKISEDWKIDTTASYYDAFRDRSVKANFNDLDPANNYTGQVTDAKAWWASYDLKLATDKFLGREDLSFMGGYQFNHASLNLDVYNSNNYYAATTHLKTTDTGGATQTNSAFSQLSWRFMPDWEIMAGVRMDHWQAQDGHSRTFDNPATRANEQNIQNYADRSATRFSPKASLEYSPDAWTFRYSFSKAYRFPIVEEMFLSAATLNNLKVAYPGLGPEHGYFHNFMAKYDIPRGYIQADVFYNTVSDEINSSIQNFGVTQVSTFLPIDKTEAVGVDLVFQQKDILNLPLDLMVNGTWIHKRIIENARNTALVGNQWNQIPKLQVNANLTYHLLPAWDAAVGVRYRSNEYQRIDNSDIAAHVYGGTDEYTLVDLKTSYQLPVVAGMKSTLSAGIDNVLNQNVFENHPYPQRTYFLKASFKY